MKSFAAIIFATVAVLAATSAVPVPVDTRNQDCKKPAQEVFDDCMPNGGTAVACNDAYQAANKLCDDAFKTSIS